MYEFTSMTPLQVMQSTMGELFEVLDGVRRREERQMRTMAYWVANLMNATGNFHKNPMTADRLLGRSSKDKEAMKRRAEARKRAASGSNRVSG